MQTSSRSHACPVCGRNTDADCRFGDDLVLCHQGSSFAPPSDLKPGDTIDIDGRPWALIRRDAGFSGRAAVFRPHRQQLHQQLRPYNRAHRAIAVQVISDLDGLENSLADLDTLANEALCIPPLDQMLDSDIHEAREVCAVAHDVARSLLPRLARASRHDASLLQTLWDLQRLQRDLRYQLEDLTRYVNNPAAYWEAFLLWRA